jgi:hypothetical protein
MFAVIVVMIPELLLMLTVAFMVKCDKINPIDGLCYKIHLENRKLADKYVLRIISILLKFQVPP